MDYTIRQARLEDLEGAVLSEELAMSSSGYLRDVFDLFFNDRLGKLLVAEVPSGEIVAVAKYTVVYDGTAWLETLRVKPEYQRRGIGREFYVEFVKLSEQLGIDTMRMYTGVTNVPSASLARLFGLEREGVFREAALDIPADCKAEPDASFVQLCPAEAVEAIAPLSEGWRGFITLNRTFYKMTPALYEGLAAEGKVLSDKNGTVMVLGNRFLPRRSLQIGIVGGDVQKCLNHAKAVALQLGLTKLIIMFPPEDTALQALLEQNGFVCMASDLTVMGGKIL